MSYVRIWLHCVWGTKNRFPFLVPEKRDIIYSHITKSSKDKGIYIDCLNGSADHMHAIISLAADDSISKVMQQIKGESSHWINKDNILPNFGWAREYFAIFLCDNREALLRAKARGNEDSIPHAKSVGLV